LIADLEQRKESLIGELRDLEAQRALVDETAYLQQKAELERLAVGTLRELDTLTRRPPTDAPPTAHHRGRRGIAAWVGVGLAALGLVALFFLPGEQEVVAPEDPELAAVLARLTENPGDVDALVRGSQILLEQGDLGEASRFADRALQLDPESPSALVQWAALLAARNQAGEALTLLDQVVTRHPEYVAAWSLRGLLALQLGNKEVARESLAQYLERAPLGPRSDELRSILDKLAGDGDRGVEGSAGNHGTGTGRPAQDNARGMGKAAIDAQAIWISRCAMCHGDSGRGDTPTGRALALPDMTEQKWQDRVTDEAMHRAITRGVVREVEGRTRRMQPFSDLSREQVEALVALIRSFE
jgi:tetratricopeptide (TPR) repeat protein